MKIEKKVVIELSNDDIEDLRLIIDFAKTEVSLDRIVKDEKKLSGFPKGYEALRLMSAYKLAEELREL